MYQPAHHREDDLGRQHAFLRANPLATLVTLGAGGLVANPVPLVLHPETGALGTLRGHLARANPQWRDSDPAVDCLAVFQGPDAYVTPGWYATKRETGKVVPTWNYVMVQAAGRLRVIEDADWLLDQVRALTAQHEAGREAAWAVEDAPPDFVRAMLRGIVGIEIAITRIEGKWKTSQNRTLADREGVAAGLRAEGEAAMADLVPLAP